MNANNKAITKIEIEKKLEDTMNMRLNEFKYETVRYIYIKLSYLSSNKYPSSYDQPSSDIIMRDIKKSQHQD